MPDRIKSGRTDDVQNKFLAALMDAIPDRIYFKDREGRFLSVNRAFLDFLGLKSETELQGKTDFDIFLPEHAEPARDDEKRILASGNPILGKVEKEALPDGRVLWASTMKAPLRNASGDIIGICGISRDITEEYRQTERTREYAILLGDKQRQLEEELLLAQQVQQAMLPSRHPAFPPWAKEEESAISISHRYHPVGKVGGDFFAVLPVSPTRAGILICDVMGHGVHAALIAAVQRGLVDDLRSLADDPGGFLTELNKRLHSILSHMRTTLFVTALYAVLDASDGKVRFSSAAHPVPLVLGAAGSARPLGKGSFLKFSPPLGMVDDSRYEFREDSIAVGERLLFYTDGLFDVGDAEPCPHDDVWLLDAADRCMAAAAGADTPFMDLLLEEARRSTVGAGFLDDVCMVEVVFQRLLS